MKVRILILIMIAYSMTIKAQLNFYYSGATASVAPNYASYYLIGGSGSYVKRESNYKNDVYVIPETVKYEGLEYTVTSLSKGAFAGYEPEYQSYSGSLAKSITLPSSIHTIGDYAFARCPNLISMVIPSSVKTIGKDAFVGCNRLREMIYLSETPPNGWCATSFTYVPNINNYEKPTYSWGDASIIPMITFGENEFVYTGNVPKTTWTNNVVGYEASLEMPTLQKDVGTYQEIIPVTFTKGDESYTINITYNYEIKPAVLTATVNDYSKVYGDPDPSFSVSVTGFINGEDESVISQYPIAKTDYVYKVGKYPIKISGGEAKNYVFDYKDGELTIVPRVLSVSVGNYQREYNKDNPFFVLTYDGFVGNDNESNTNSFIRPDVSTTATRMSDVGVYPITISGGGAINYTFSYSDGTLTITKAEQNVEWKQNLERLFVGDQVELLAKGSSNQPIKYIIDETDCAELYNAGNKTYLNCKKAGRFQIKAIQEGNANYYSSQMANNTAIIFGIGEDDPTLTIKQCDYGTISAQVIKGSSYEFSIKSEKGWKIHSVSFNNSDVTSKIIDGYLYKTPEITYNSTLSVVYEKDNNDEINTEEDSQVKIYSMTFGIRVKDAQPSEIVEVYSPDGILIKSVKVESPIMDVLLTKGKMYVVKVGQKIVKLSI